MSYINILTSRFAKRPLWLYEFNRNGRYWLWTSRSKTYVESLPDVYSVTDVYSGTDVFNKRWESTPIGHSRFRITSSTARAETSFIFNGSNEMASLYFNGNDSVSNTVTVYHEFLNDPDNERIVKFRGRVIGTETMLTKFTLVAENNFTELRRKGLTAVIQRPCRHALYHSLGGVGCNLLLSNFQDDVKCTSVSGKIVTVVSAISRPDGYYNGGIFTFGNRQQLILKHAGGTIQLASIITGLSDAVSNAGVEGLDVKLAPGCDLTRQTCNDRFNNLANHGGFPWADDTPFDGKTLF